MQSILSALTPLSESTHEVGTSLQSHSPVSHDSPIAYSCYREATKLRVLADSLQEHSVVAENSNSITSDQLEWCADIKLAFEEIISNLQTNYNRGESTVDTAIRLARKGWDVCHPS